MNAIERHYRLLTLQERLRQIEGEFLVLAETTTGAERYRIERAAWNAARSAELAQDAPESPSDLTAMLRLSIQVAREKKKLKECPGNGNGPGPVNLSRFPKSSTFLVNESEGEP